MDRLNFSLPGDARSVNYFLMSLLQGFCPSYKQFSENAPSSQSGCD
jgi:hypothetical protein